MEHPNRTTTLQTLSEENAQRDLYRQEKGDGPHPQPLSSMAEKLNPYGFIRIHRSVVVNISAVEEVQPLPTGEYRLRVKGGKKYLVTRTYKHNLRDLAQLWVGSERLCG